MCKVLFVTFNACCCCWDSFETSREGAELPGVWPRLWVIWLASWALAAAESRLLAGKEAGWGCLWWWRKAPMGRPEGPAAPRPRTGPAGEPGAFPGRLPLSRARERM